jgi:hypothetical protein
MGDWLRLAALAIDESTPPSPVELVVGAVPIGPPVYRCPKLLEYRFLGGTGVGPTS